MWRITVNKLRSTAALSRQLHTIQAVPREVKGPKISARDRAQGRIPCVVLSPPSSTVDDPRKQLLTAESKQIQSLLKDVGPDFFCSTPFKLDVRAGSGSSVLLSSGHVLPIKLHRDPQTGQVLNMVFLWADEGSQLKVDVPIVFKGQDSCPGLKQGGQLYQIRKRLKYLCPTECIPQKIEVDISNLEIGGRILLKDIKVDPSLKLLSGKETKPICKILALKEFQIKTVDLDVEAVKPLET